MVADVVVSTAKSFPDAATLALVSDVQFREPYSSGAINRKFRGIVNPGIYSGFTPSPAGGLTLQIASGEEGGTASVNIDKFYQLTVRQQADVTLAMTAGKTAIVVLEASYVQGQETYQVNANSAIQAVEIKLLESGTQLSSNQLELCTVTIPSGAKEITGDMIDTTGRVIVKLGTEYSNDYDSDEEGKAATPKGLKDGLSRRQPLDDTLSELSGKSVEEILEYLRLRESIELAENAVPSSRKVNDKSLSDDIKLSADDVAAVPGTIRGVIRGDITMASANKTGWWQVAVPDTSKVSDFPKKTDGTRLYGYGYMFVWIIGDTWFQHYYAHHGEVAFRQDWDAGPSASVEWSIDYNTANKPGATDVGALPLAGGKMLGDITLKNGGLIFPEEGYQNKAVGRCGTYAAVSLNYRWELYAYSKANNALRTNIITADVVDISKGNESGGDRNNPTTTITLHGEIMTPFKFVPGNYSNFDARYQAKGNYTPSGQAYTKEESNARYVADVQLGAGTTKTTWNASGNWPKAAGYVITSVWKDAEGSNLDGVTYAPLQKKIGPTWYTVGGGLA